MSSTKDVEQKPKRAKAKPASAYRPPPLRERKKGQKAADATARRVGSMSADARRELMRELKNDLAEMSVSVEIVESDPFRALLLVAAEFIARYFPDANQATMHITRYPGKNSLPDWNVMLPLATPAASDSRSGGEVPSSSSPVQ